MKKVHKSTITCLASEGRLTLQVPDVMLTISGMPDDPVVEEVEPMEVVQDDHFIYLKGGNHKVCVGRESGYLFFTEAGFNHYREELKAAFNSYQQRGHTWEEFEAYAAKEFEKRKQAAAKQLATAEERLAELKSLIARGL